MTDLLVIETGNGGDLVYRGKDLVNVEGYENFPYLAMFSGQDWWGNDLLLSGDISTKFNSQTDKVIQEVALNSAGRIKIEEAIKTDLAFIAKNVPGTEVTVATSIRSDDRLEIDITIDGKQFYYLYAPDTGFLTYKV